MTPNPTPSSRRRRAIAPLLLLAALSWLGGATIFAAESAKKNYELPAGDAATTLKQFVEQSGEQVVYLINKVRGVRTNAVKGELTAREALDRMLTGTGLSAAQDEKTSALTVNRAPGPNAARAAQNPDSGDRPAKQNANPPSPDTTGNPMTPNKRSRLITALAAIFVGSTASAAQPSDSSSALAARSEGMVTGQISNAATGEFLTAARIDVEGTAVSATTDRGGEYFLSLPPGDHVLVVRYAGLETAHVPISVLVGARVTRNVELSSDIYKMEALTVTSIREGSAKAIMNQRESINVKSVAAIDAFGNPGGTVGELIQRLPGVAVDIGAGGEPTAISIRGMNQSFGSFLVDGNQLAVTDGQTLGNTYNYFGQVSTTNVESLELIKAPLPEMDGNAISGYINVRTRRAFDRAPGRSFVVTAGTRWTNLRQDDSVPGKDRPKFDALNVDYGEVFSAFGGRNNLGVELSLSRNAANLSYTANYGGWAIGGNVAGLLVPLTKTDGSVEPLMRGYSASHSGANSRNSYRTNVGLNIDYKLNADTNLHYKNTYSNSRIESGVFPGIFRMLAFTGATATNFDPVSTYDVIDVKPAGTTVELQSTLASGGTESYTNGLGFEHKMMQGSAKLTVDFLHSYNQSSYPNYTEMKARMSGAGFRIDRRGQDPWLPKITQTSGPNWSDPASYAVVAAAGSGATAGSRVMNFFVPASNTHYRVDFRKDLAMKFPTFIQVGAKHNLTRQHSDRNYVYYTWNGPATGITSIVGYNMKMAEGNYGPFPFPQLAHTGLPNDPWKDPNNWKQTPGNAYQAYVDHMGSLAFATEEISAGYVEAQTKISRLRILGGVRLEQTEPEGRAPLKIAQIAQNNNTADNNLSTAENIDRAKRVFSGWGIQHSRYRNAFPGLHFVYDLGHGLQARASYSKSITRPGLGNVIPNYTVNDISRTISRGNVALKPYTSDNYELGLEYYFEPVGRLAMSAFDKEITNYFRNFNTVIPGGADNGYGGAYEGYVLTTARNVGSARIRGLELDYWQQFTFLPGGFRGLGFHANATFLRTSGDYGGALPPKALANFTPRTLNAGLNYRGYGFDLRVEANYKGRTYQSTVGTVDLFQKDRLMIDFKGQYSISRRYSVYLDVYNLSKELSFAQVFDAFGRKDNYWQVNDTGMIFAAGIKARF